MYKTEFLFYEPPTFTLTMHSLESLTEEVGHAQCDVTLNAIFSDTAILFPLKMYGILQRSVLAIPSAERQRLVAICRTLALTSKKCLEPNRTATVN